MNVRFYLSYDIKITLKSHCWRKNIINVYCHYVRNVVMDAITFPVMLVVDTSGLLIYCMALFHSQTRHHMINISYKNHHGYPCCRLLSPRLPSPCLGVSE